MVQAAEMSDVKLITKQMTITFLTLNCWSIPYVSKNRKPRMTAIADKFVMDKYDIICLQEVWSVDDFKLIKNKTKELLPYSHYFHSGVLGSGICILSKYPIQDVMFHKWALNGYVHKIHHGDWFGGKGVGLCRLKVQDMNVNVYTAHLHAEYNRPNDEYMAHRVLQAFDTAQFIRLTSSGADAIILGGDLNTEPQDLAYKIICGTAGLNDACPNSSSNLGTNECANNSYTSLKVARKCPDGKRIDYILYLGSKDVKVEVADYQYPFPKRVPSKHFSYSDHEAVMATLKLYPGTCERNKFDVRESLKEALVICETALKNINRQRYWYLLLVFILMVPLIWTMGLECSTTSVGVSIGLNIGRLFLSAILCYILFMSSMWNSVEANGLKAGCMGMEIHLMQLNNIVE